MGSNCPRFPRIFSKSQRASFARAIWSIILCQFALSPSICLGQSEFAQPASDTAPLLWRNNIEFTASPRSQRVHEARNGNNVHNALRLDLQNALVQKAPLRLVGMPLRHWLLGKDARGKAEAIDTVQTQKTVRHMEARLAQHGYFNGDVQTHWASDRGKVEQTFSVRTGAQWRWGDVSCSSDSTGFDAHEVLAALTSVTGVVKGGDVDLGALEDFRESWSKDQQALGYLGLLSEHVSYIMDTSAVVHRVQLEMVVRSAIDGPHRVAVLHEIVVDAPGIDSAVVASMLRVKVGDRHNPSEIERTYRRLAQLPAVQHVDVKVEQVLDGAADERGLRPVKLAFFVRPKKRLDWGYRAGVLSQQGLGAEAAIRFSDHNFRGRSERLQLFLNVSMNSIPAQVDGGADGGGGGSQATAFNAFSYGPQLVWRMDRLLPFGPERFPQSNEPVSQLELGWSQEHRPDFDRRIARLSLVERFVERADRGSEIQLRPVDFSFAQIELTPQGQTFLDAISSPVVRNAYTSHAILASGLSWSLSPEMGARADLRVRGGGSAGGHLFSALIAPGDSVAWIGGGSGADGGSGGVPVSRFVKMHFEAVAGWIPGWSDWGRGVSWHFRCLAAIGHSTAPGLPMPLERMELVGGPNSMRGWLAQTLGPGGFDKSQSGEIYARGDMRLEANLELRLQLGKGWSIAGFTDAGNVWMTTPDALRPGADFQWDRFAGEIAVSMGAGLRFDFEYFMVRLDAGRPVRSPVIGEEIQRGAWSFHPAVALPF
jgi:hypothetical protein